MSCLFFSLAHDVRSWNRETLVINCCWEEGGGASVEVLCFYPLPLFRWYSHEPRFCFSYFKFSLYWTCHRNRSALTLPLSSCQCWVAGLTLLELTQKLESWSGIKDVATWIDPLPGWKTWIVFYFHLWHSYTSLTSPLGLSHSDCPYSQGRVKKGNCFMTQAYILPKWKGTVGAILTWTSSPADAWCLEVRLMEPLGQGLSSEWEVRIREA